MAIEKRQAHPVGHGETESRTDFEAVLDHVRDNPLIYVATTVFIVVAVIAGFVYMSVSEASRKEHATVYLQALLEEDDAERAAALTQAATNLQGDLAAEALYMAGESAYRAGELENAQRHFERVRSEHAASAWAAPAIEGLGYILEQQDDAQGAMELYREVQNNHANAFEARRQWFNLGRAAERIDDIGGAIGHYNEQITAFPGSSVAQQAQAALNRLRNDHPDLFPDDLSLDAPLEPGIIPLTPALDSPTTDTPAIEVLEDVPATELETTVDTPEEGSSDADAPDPGEVTPEPAADAPEPVEVDAGAVDEAVEEPAE